MTDGESIDNLSALYGELLDDVHYHLSTLDMGKSEANKRAIVRAVFAFIEGLSNALKHFDSDKFSTAERALIREETYQLSENGEAFAKKALLPTLANIRFSFAIFAKLNGMDFKPDISGQGWQCLAPPTMPGDPGRRSAAIWRAIG